LIPEVAFGKIFKWDLSEIDIQFLSANVNDTSSFHIEYTPFDHLCTVRRVLVFYIESKGLRNTQPSEVEV
jgi:hypothetical protein